MTETRPEDRRVPSSPESPTSGSIEASSWAIAWTRTPPTLGGGGWLRAGLLAALVALGAACSSGTSPTLPIPPPSALTSAPDEDGVVTITGNGAIEGALVSAYNERTERGVIETADDTGAFVLRLEAQTGDSILVWQRVGTQSGQVLSLGVP
jgi:hypothetical protein